MLSRVLMYLSMGCSVEKPSGNLGRLLPPSCAPSSAARTLLACNPQGSSRFERVCTTQQDQLHALASSASAGMCDPAATGQSCGHVLQCTLTCITGIMASLYNLLWWLMSVSDLM